MQRTRVKICGITNRDDAMCAVDNGADAVGFIFFNKSPRSIAVDEAAAIVASLPAYVTPVGVIVNESLADAQRIAAESGVHVLQCHGDEDADYCRQLTVPFIKVIRINTISDIRAYEGQFPGATSLMMEKHSDRAYGGTGETIDWDERAPMPGLVLAGGLTPDNVAEAVTCVQPYAVDVASGVERQKGLKDHLRVKAFIAAVRAADETRGQANAIDA